MSDAYERHYAKTNGRRAYSKEWYVTNKEEKKAKSRAYNAANKVRLNASKRAWRKKNKEALKLVYCLGIKIAEARILLKQRGQ